MGKKEASKRLKVEYFGRVSGAPFGMKEWHVASESEEGKSYRVRGNPSKDDYECECKDFAFRGGRCKHIEAVSSLIRRKVSPNDAAKGKHSPSSSKDLDAKRIMKAATEAGMQIRREKAEAEELEQQEKEINEFMDY